MIKVYFIRKKTLFDLKISNGNLVYYFHCFHVDDAMIQTYEHWINITSHIQDVISQTTSIKAITLLTDSGPWIDRW